MRSFKGNIDYEGRILEQQEIDAGYYLPCVRPENPNMDLTDNRTVKEMIIESKYYLLGLIVRKRNS